MKKIKPQKQISHFAIWFLNQFCKRGSRGICGGSIYQTITRKGGAVCFLYVFFTAVSSFPIYRGGEKNEYMEKEEKVVKECPEIEGAIRDKDEMIEGKKYFRMTWNWTERGREYVKTPIVFILWVDASRTTFVYKLKIARKIFGFPIGKKWIYMPGSVADYGFEPYDNGLWNKHNYIVEE